MAQKRLKIGIDIDGVLVDTDSSAYLKFCETELGWNINYELFERTHSWVDATGKSKSEIIGQAFGQFLAQVEESQKPIEGAHDALKKLGKVADMYLITARAGFLQKVTEDFLRLHLPDVNYYKISMGNLDNKAPQLINFGVDYFIDDSHREISLILQEKAMRAKIIPFPAFHGAPQWAGMTDERIHWLSVWKGFTHAVDPQQRGDIRRKAWEEIAELMLKLDK